MTYIIPDQTMCLSQKNKKLKEKKTEKIVHNLKGFKLSFCSYILLVIENYLSFSLDL
jgi:seryl-tRNA synthetase